MMPAPEFQTWEVHLLEQLARGRRSKTIVSALRITILMFGFP
jgi:hypothetical protein